MIYPESSGRPHDSEGTHVEKNPHIGVEGYPVVIVASSSYSIIPCALLLVLELVLQRVLQQPFLAIISYA